MQKKLRIHLAIPLIAAGLFCFSQHIFAAQSSTQVLTPTQKTDMKQALDNMTPAQREALHKKMEQKWNNMTPAQKQAVREKMQQEWETMTPEEKQAAREKVNAELQNMTPAEKRALAEQQLKNKSTQQSNVGT